MAGQRNRSTEHKAFRAQLLIGEVPGGKPLKLCDLLITEEEFECPTEPPNANLLVPIGPNPDRFGCCSRTHIIETPSLCQSDCSLSVACLQGSMVAGPRHMPAGGLAPKWPLDASELKRPLEPKVGHLNLPTRHRTESDRTRSNLDTHAGARVRRWSHGRRAQSNKGNRMTSRAFNRGLPVSPPLLPEAHECEQEQADGDGVTHQLGRP